MVELKFKDVTCFRCNNSFRTALTDPIERTPLCPFCKLERTVSPQHMQSGASDAVKTLTRLLEERLSTEEGQRRLGELASQIVYGARDRPGNHLKFCEVVPLEHGQWAVLGSLPWTDQYKKHYAVCPTIEAAYAAQRLLSGRAEKELREDERERRYETT